MHAVGTVAGLCLVVKPSALPGCCATMVGARRAEIGRRIPDGHTGAGARGRSASSARASKQASTPHPSDAPSKARRNGRSGVAPRPASPTAAPAGATQSMRPSGRRRRMSIRASATSMSATSPRPTLPQPSNRTGASRTRRWCGCATASSCAAWAMQREHRVDGPNPARWRGNLDAALPRPMKVNRREAPSGADRRGSCLRPAFAATGRHERLRPRIHDPDRKPVRCRESCRMGRDPTPTRKPGPSPASR